MVLVAAGGWALVNTQPDGVYAHGLDQTFPRAYPYPLQDLVLQSAGGSTTNVVAPGTTLTTQSDAAVSVGAFGSGWQLGDSSVSAKLDADPTRTDWTIAFRFRVREAWSQQEQGLLQMGDLRVKLVSGQLQAGATLEASVNGNPITSGVTQPADGLWHHLVVEYAADVKCVSVFVDNSLDGRRCNVTLPPLASDRASYDSIYLGAGLNGWIDGLFVYRRALTADQRTQLFLRADAGLARVYPPAMPGSPELATPRFTSVPPAAPGSTLCSTVNDGASASLSCPAGQVIREVRQALYGTPDGSCEVGWTPSSCNAEGVDARVRERCIGKASCTFSAPHLEFGDPCGGTAKKFVAKAICATPVTPPGDQSPMGPAEVTPLDLTAGKLSWTQGPSPDLVGTRGLTLAGWIRLPSGRTLASQDETLLEIASQLSLKVVKGQLVASVATQPSGAIETIRASADPSTPQLVPGRWHFVAYTYSAAGATLSIDGYSVASAPAGRARVLTDAAKVVTMGGGTGVEIAWLAHYVTALSPSRLEALRHLGPASWVLPGTVSGSSAGASVVLPNDITGSVATLSNGTLLPLARFQPAGAVPPASSSRVTLATGGTGASAISFDGSTGPLQQGPFSAFVQWEAPSGASTIPFIGLKPSFASPQAPFTSTLVCGADAKCRMRVAGYTSSGSTTPDACVLGAYGAPPAGIVNLTCGSGSVIGGLVTGFADASGTCQSGLASVDSPAQTFDSFNFGVLCAGKAQCDVGRAELAMSGNSYLVGKQIGITASCTPGASANYCATQPAAADVSGPVTFDCGEGKVFKRIDVAGYARLMSEDCGKNYLKMKQRRPYMSSLAGVLSIDSYLDRTEQARKNCLEKRTCTLSGTAAEIVKGTTGLLAVGVRNTPDINKALLRGVCLPGAPQASNTCGAANDSTGMTLSCPSGQLISEVKEALYGTPSGSCDAGWTASSCNAANVLTRVRERCVGRASCAFAIPSQEFGDPCGGKPKQFVVKAVCTPADQSPPTSPVCHRSLATDQQPVTLSCPAGFVFGTVERALVTSKNLNPGVTECTNPLAFTPSELCPGGDVRTLLQSRCTGRDRCVVEPFANAPCPNLAAADTKFQASLTCVPGTPPVSVCLREDVQTTNPPSDPKLSCPAGYVIETIDYAAYGGGVGTCDAPKVSCAWDPQTKGKIEAACTARQSCTLDASVLSTTPGNGCAAAATRSVLVRATCSARAPRVWLSDSFPAPGAGQLGTLAMSWDEVAPKLATDGASVSFSLDPSPAAYLPSPLPANAGRLDLFAGPGWSSTAASARLSLAELRLYGRALSRGELEAITSSCDTRNCGSVNRQCVDRSTYANARPITAQCTGCKPGYWSPTGPGDDCEPDLGFMAACSANAQCCPSDLQDSNGACAPASASSGDGLCIEGRCGSTRADFVKAQCGGVGQLTANNGRRCGACAPGFTTSTLPGSPPCTWTPTKETGEYCELDAECKSGACARDNIKGYTVSNPGAWYISQTFGETAASLACPAGSVIDVVFADIGYPQPSNPLMAKSRRVVSPTGRDSPFAFKYDASSGALPQGQVPTWSPDITNCYNHATYDVTAGLATLCNDRQTCTAPAPSERVTNDCTLSPRFPNDPRDALSYNVVAYRCIVVGQGGAIAPVTDTQPKGTCRPAKCAECETDRFQCQLSSYALPADIEARTPAYSSLKRGARTPVCNECKPGMHKEYRLLSPAACNKANELALKSHEVKATGLGAQYVGVPRLKSLRNLFVLEGKDTDAATGKAGAMRADVTGEQVSRLLDLGVGGEYLAMAGLESQAAGALFATYTSAAGVDASLGNCDDSASPFADPVRNGLVCRPDRQPNGAKCPPAGQESVDLPANSWCISQFCSPDGVCATAAAQIDRTDGPASANGANESPGSDLGPMKSTQANEAIVSIRSSVPRTNGICATTATTDQNSSQTKSTLQQTSTIMGAAGDIYDIQLDVRSFGRSNGVGKLDADLTAYVYGIPLGTFSPKEDATCGRAGQPSCVTAKREDIEKKPEVKQVGIPGLGLLTKKLTDTMVWADNIQPFGIPIAFQLKPFIKIELKIGYGVDVAGSGLSLGSGVTPGISLGIQAMIGLGWVEPRKPGQAKNEANKKAGSGKYLDIALKATEQELDQAEERPTYGGDIDNGLFLGAVADISIIAFRFPVRRSVVTRYEQIKVAPAQASTVKATYGYNLESLDSQKFVITLLEVKIKVVVQVALVGYAITLFEKQVYHFDGFDFDPYNNVKKDPPIWFVPCFAP
jgi:hypothetical protein